MCEITLTLGPVCLSGLMSKWWPVVELFFIIQSSSEFFFTSFLLPPSPLPCFTHNTPPPPPPTPSHVLLSPHNTYTTLYILLYNIDPNKQNNNVLHYTKQLKLVHTTVCSIYIDYKYLNNNIQKFVIAILAIFKQYSRKTF